MRHHVAEPNATTIDAADAGAPVERARRLGDDPGVVALDALVRATARALRAPIAFACERHRDRQSVHVHGALAAARGDGRGDAPVARLTLPLARSFARQVLDAGAPLLVEDAEREPAVAEGAWRPEFGAVAFAGVPVMGPDGRPCGALCVADVEPRRWAREDAALLAELADLMAAGARLRARAARAERDAALIRRTAPLRLLFEQVPAAIWTTDAALRLTHTQAGRVELERRADELVGYSVYELFATDDPRHPAVEAHLRALRGDTVTYETSLGDRTFSARVQPLRAAGGEVAGVIGVALDVTDRARTEQALRETRAALAATEAQLRHAQKLEPVGRLAGGIVHDFNNLLSIIRSYCDFLAADIPEGDHRRADVAEIQHATDRAVALTRQLLSMVRRRDAEPRVIEANHLVLGLEGMLRRLLFERIELRTALTIEPTPVLADAGHLEQVLLNLVVNARDAMPDGGTLTIATEVARDGTGPDAPHVSIAVTDTGTGMDEATLGHIFEPFFTTKEPGKGTGLGLSTAQSIVEASGGRITVESTLGCGTTVRVYLPLADE